MQKKYLPVLFLLTLLISVSSVIATAPIVKIFSYEEALTTQNLSKPRIYIQNLAGSVPISNFYYYYYFTVENNKTPAPPEDYYTPNSIPSLESLGNGRYRIKFTFLGVTLQPGQILPNTGGEVIGIRYTDWTPLDKTNDHSNNLSGSFVLNPNVPVFLADGTQIYGNLPPDPANPPQPPPVYGSISDFAVFSEEYTDLRDRVKITAGNVGSSAYTELGCDDTLYGDVLSKGTIFLRERARIYGDVTSGQVVNMQNNVYIQGIFRNYAQMELPVLQTPFVTIGTTNVSVSPNGSYTLSPGIYNSFRAYANVSLTIQPGEYSFREFILEPNVAVTLSVGHGDHINIKVKDNCRLGNGTNMTLPAGINTPYALSIHSAQTSELYIGTDAFIKGLIFAPDAEVHVYSRTNIAGSIYGRRVVIEPDVRLCRPPTLLNLSHLEGAIAPPFNPMTFDYIAVVPDVTATIVVIPEVRAGQTVTVNGQAPTDTINLTGAETDVIMLLTHPEACGTTEYKLKVKRSADYRIFVDPESPCTPGNENGQTWTTAFKDLKVALDSAAKTGKEIWLREGIYIPTVRSNPSDPRSATFLIPSGTEIKGGFTGTEIDDKPLGSIFNTILSGDANGDDTNFTSWPPIGSDSQYVDDNNYHVVTVVGNTGGNDIHISNVIITHGYANGSGIDASGAGILIKSGNPHLEFVGIVNNYAKSSGAGIYVSETGGLDTLKNTLFQGLESKTGSGAGLCYMSTYPLVINASVFDSNTTKDTSSTQGGSAIYFKGTNATLINCVFAKNNSNSIKGAVLNDAGMLYVLNCTFGYNISNGAVSITNINGGSTEVLNSILRNTAGKNEVSGSNFTINYTCITNGFSGTGNISSNPLFTNYSNPRGDNGKYGDMDDGLHLSNGSPCVNWATSTGAPDVDILTVPRPEGYWYDMGAYEYVDVVQGNEMELGQMFDGTFSVDGNLTIIHNMMHHREVYQYSKSNYSRVARAYVEKNKYTQAKSIIKGYIQPADAVGNPVKDAMEVRLKKVGEVEGFLIFQSKTTDYSWGKDIIFTGDPIWHGFDNPWAYVIYVPDNPSLILTVPYDQF